MTNSLTVTHENYDEVLETVILGNIALQNYNSHCVSSSDVRLAYAGTDLLQKIVEVVVNTGNSVYMMTQPKFLTSGYDCNYHYNEADFAHITEITPFSVEIPNVAPTFAVCQNAQRSVTDRDAYIAEMKYR